MERSGIAIRLQPIVGQYLILILWNVPPISLVSAQRAESLGFNDAPPLLTGLSFVRL